MLRKYRRLIVAAIIGASAAALIPTSPAAAMAVCHGRSTGGTGFGQTAYVAGAYTTAGASDIQLTCGIVQNGVTVRRFSDQFSGPVAALAGQASVSDAPFTICTELYIAYSDGRAPTYSDNCP